MPADRPTETELVDLVRERLRSRETPASDALWSRVASRLDAPARREHPRARMTVVHSSVRRMRRLAAVAAALLLAVGLAWFAATRERPAEQLVSAERLQRTLDRQALEGPLELDGASRPLGRDLYEGVAVKLGTARTDALRACDPC